MEQAGQNRLASAKWSRNLSEDVQSEANRMRLLEKQRQILETKLQRRQNQSAAGSVVASRPATSVSGARTRIPQATPTSEMSFDFSAEPIVKSIEPNDRVVSKTATAIQARARTSIAGQRRLASLDSPSSPTSLSSNTSLKSQHQSVAVQRPPTGSSTSTNVTGNITSTNKGNIRNLANLNRSDGNIAATVVGDKQAAAESLIFPNPLVTILSDDELLKFVSQPVPPEVTLQCTIIRDKKGLDRSFYPTYYMHLQEIIRTSAVDEKGNETKGGAGIQGTATISMSDSVDSLESVDSNEDVDADKKMSSSLSNSSGLNGGGGGSSGKNNSTITRKVFVLSGRRRKKSKTYLIGNNAFDISRDRCIAKLKSNVLGTQFTAIKLNSNGVRYEIASITYETNVLGFKGPRKMNILIPKPDEKTNAIVNLSLQEEFKRHSPAIIQLKNKTPIWNEETQSYVLNFHGRVTQASVKNFQLVMTEHSGSNRDYYDRQAGGGGRMMGKSASTHQLNQRYEDANTLDSNFEDDNLSDEDSESDDDDVDGKGNSHNNLRAATTNNNKSSMLSKNLSKSGYLPTEEPTITKSVTAITDNNDLVSLQFGRVSNTQFSCDVSWPFSLMQAFAIALSSFDSKLACE